MASSSPLRPAREVNDFIDNDSDRSSVAFIPRHRWTTFEMNAVLALLCKGVHRAKSKGKNGKKGTKVTKDQVSQSHCQPHPAAASNHSLAQMSKDKILTFATALNECLNRGSAGSGGPDFHADIPLEEVEALLTRLGKEKKSAMAYIETHPPMRITRAKRLVFKRDIGFDGSKVEWKTGRREKMLAEVGGKVRRMREYRLAEEREQERQGRRGEAARASSRT
jgi:hypothetical protein